MNSGILATIPERQYQVTRRTVLSSDIGYRIRGQITFVVIGSVLLILAITRQSLWIDEAWTAWFAAQENTRSLLHALILANGSDAQMPGYLLYMHAWITLFGRDETALRLSNLPFAVLFLSSLSWVSTTLLKRPYAWTIVALSPFLWFYMNEARPYVAVMAFSSVVAASVLAYCIDQQERERVAPWVATAGFTAALGSYMLTAFLGPTVLLLLALSTKDRRRRLLTDWRRPVLVFLPLIAAICAYYAWTVFRGAGGLRRETGLKNIAFVLYEFSGFAGLGPPRNDLRATGGADLLSYWPTLVLGSVALLSVLAVVAIASHRQIDRWFALSLGVGPLITTVACKIVHHRFLGRHFAAFFPFVLIALLMNTRTRDKGKHRWLMACAFTLLAVVWAVSDARLVLLPAYGKENYRDAAAIAIERGRPDGWAILWAADGTTASYYGLKTNDTSLNYILGNPRTSEAVNWPVLGRATYASNWTSAEVCGYASGNHTAIILVLSNKPDLFDQNGTWAWLLQQPEIHATPIASLNGFEVYQLPMDKSRSINGCGQNALAAKTRFWPWP